ncbi:MAG: hypothetical protein AB7F50_01665 [Fimbriimonadaceae bacterium]
MSRLTLLRVARWAKGRVADAEYPHLETLVDEETAKVSDGYHYARWIVPMVGVGLAAACFLPLALIGHPLFWIGVAGLPVLGGGLGAVFHVFASRISPTQLEIRKRCIALANKLTSAQNLLGHSPVVSPRIARILDEAAAVYLKVRPNSERDRRTRSVDAWSEASQGALRAMDDAMAQLLALADPVSPSAQESVLEQGWAKPLLAEMKATADALANQRVAAQLTGEGLHSAAAPLSQLSEARAQLQRLETALQELDLDPQHHQT